MHMLEREGDRAERVPVSSQGPGAHQDVFGVVDLLPDAQLDYNIERGDIPVLLSGGVTRRSHARGEGREQHRTRQQRVAPNHWNDSLTTVATAPTSAQSKPGHPRKYV